MNDNFNSERLKYARIKNGLTIIGLSELLGITNRTLSKYENKHDIPREDLVKKMAALLKVPVSFFYQDDFPTVEMDRVSFRRVARTPAMQIERSIYSGKLAVQLSYWISNRFNLPKPNIPDLKHETPAAAAEALRAYWGLGNKSITNIIHLLELHGVFVFSIYQDNKDIDAFCFQEGGRSFIFLNKYKSAERSRFDAAHELGHLVLHQHGVPVGKEREKEADEFASAFLMPEASIRSYGKVCYMPTVDELIDLKRQWKVSVSALLRRFYDLGMLSEWSYRSLNIQLSTRGYMKNEPNPIEHERSQLLELILKNLWQKKITKDDIAKDLHVYVNEIEELMFGAGSI